VQRRGGGCRDDGSLPRAGDRFGASVDLRRAARQVVTAPGRDELRSAVATVERAAVQSGCEIRLLYGQQAQAFVVAALPLGRGVH
jgi:hypothetical protein